MRKSLTFRPFAWDSLENRLVPSGGGIRASGVSFPNTSPATTPTQRFDAGAVAAHAAAVSLADSRRASGVVFFGDSITARWDQPGYPGLPVWNAEIAPLQAVDFGIDGDRTQNLIWRLQNGELDGRPKVAVVEIGTNNLIYWGQNETPQEAAAGITAVVQTIRAVSPNTRVLLLGLLPRAEAPSDPVRGEIQQVNGMIAGLDDGTHVRYLDLGALFLRPDGTIPPELMLTPDFLHPNTGGYQLMADALQAPLNELLGRPDPDPATYGGPVLVDMPIDQATEAPDARGALLSFAPPLAFDALDPNPVVTSSPPRGTVLPLGATVVTCTATDRYGHNVSSSFTVDVNPSAAPVLHDVPSDAVVEANSPFGAVVDFAPPTATDAGDPNVNVLCVPPSGATFPFGTTVVVCTATDHAGNVARTRFQILVRDTTPPVFVSAPNLVVEATGPSGAVVDYTQLAVADNSDPNPAVSCSPPSGTNIPIGTTTVTCTARDQSGNVSTATFRVRVIDTPVLHNAPPSLVVEATGRSGAVVRYTPPTATDVADPLIRVDNSIASGATFPLGTTVVTSSARGFSGVVASVSFTITVVPRGTVASVSTLAQDALARAAASMGAGAPPHSRPGRKLSSLVYGQRAPGQGTAAAFLSRVDANHDLQVSRGEMIAFVSAVVDLNHDGKISRYEQVLYQLHDPQGSVFLF